MKPDLERLKITERELENLSGFDVNEIFIGGVFGGVYRPSNFQNHKRLASFCLTEIFVLIVTFIFTLPIALLAIRNSPNAINDLAVILQLLQMNLGITLMVFISWNVYMWLKIKHIKALTHLLDEVDKYNEVIQAVYLLDQLEAVRNTQVNLINRNEVIEALNVTRDSLVCGLMTEKILRNNRGLLARRYDLFVNIENNLTTLRTLEVNNQANEYGQLLNNALQIGMSVRKEVQNLSDPSRSEV